MVWVLSQINLNRYPRPETCSDINTECLTASIKDIYLELILLMVNKQLPVKCRPSLHHPCFHGSYRFLENNLPVLEEMLHSSLESELLLISSNVEIETSQLSWRNIVTTGVSC